MVDLKDYIIAENIDDNLFWKLDVWFSKLPEQKSKFIDVVTQYSKNKIDKETLGFMLNNIGLDIASFVDFVLDNKDNKNEVFDCYYILQKVIETIIANKLNSYNIDNETNR